MSRVLNAVKVLVGRLDTVPPGYLNGVRVMEAPSGIGGRICDEFWVARIPCEHCGAHGGQYHRPSDPTDTHGPEWDKLRHYKCRACGHEWKDRWLHDHNDCRACGMWGEVEEV